MATTTTTPSRPFTSLKLIPFCPEDEPKSQFRRFVLNAPSESFDITNSSLDTTQKSLRFYWLLKKLVVTTVRSYTIPETEFTDTVTATTEYTFEREDLLSGGTKPYQRVCKSQLGPTNDVDFLEGSYMISFEKDGELCIHLEAPSALERSPEGVTENVVFFGITTTDDDWGFVFGEDVPYTDQTLPLEFDDGNSLNFTLYAKYIGTSGVVFESITVDEVEFYEIESQ